MFVPSSDDATFDADAAPLRGVPDVDAFARAWSEFCFSQGMRPDPTTESAQRIAWWDRPDARLHARAVQLIERRDLRARTRSFAFVQDGGVRPLPLATLERALLAGRAFGPFAGLDTTRRLHVHGDEGLEWTTWTAGESVVASAVRPLRAEGTIARWLTERAAAGVLGGDTVAPGWPDVALAVVVHGLGRSPVEEAPVDSHVALGALRRRLLRDDSLLAEPLADAMRARLAADAPIAPIPARLAHPVWEQALRAAVADDPGRRAVLLDALAHSLRRRAMRSARASSRAFRARIVALVAAREWIDAPVRGTLRDLLQNAVDCEAIEFERATDRILGELVGAADLSAEAAREIGARRHRLERRRRELERERADRERLQIRPRLRRWARDRRRRCTSTGER